MSPLLRRLTIASYAVAFFSVPLFPSFIALSGNAFPGVAVLPGPLAIAVLVVTMLCVAWWGAMLAIHRSRSTQPLLLPMAAWVGFGMLSALAGFNPAAGLLFVPLFGVGGILWHCSLVRFFDEPGMARAIFWSYLLSGTLAAAVAIAMIVTRVPAAQYALQHGRATGTFVLPGELAAYLVLFLPIAYALARTQSDRALAGLAWAGIGIGIVTLALTYSRAGWMGCAAAVAFFVAVATRRTRHAASAATAIVVLGAAAVLLLFNAHHDPSEDYTRLAIWRAAGQVIDRFPLTGVGPFDFPRLYALVHVPDADATAFHAHSLYLTFFAELGVLGLASFLWIGWRFAVEMRERVARLAPDSALLGLAVSAGLAGIAVQGLIDTMSIVIFGLWMPMMGLALAATTAPTTGEEEAA